MPSWRPKGWGNPYIYKHLEAKPIDTGVDFANIPEMEAFEAGADAILEALKKSICAGRLEKDGRCRILFPNSYDYTGYVPGTFVFIPDDDKPSCGLADPK